jgi:MOSC domain-containing protein YiiM
MGFELDNIVKRFIESRRTDFYMAVTREGDFSAGDEITMTDRDPKSLPVSLIIRLYVAKEYSEEDRSSMQRALRIRALPESWKEFFADRLQGLNFEVSSQ